ncbi:MAG: TetR family transcriptional regulator C-terminal domain-containing protein [Pseudomonadota bacterium]
MLSQRSEPLTRIQRARRSEILEAALEIFSQNGYRGASINKIAEAAQMSTPRLLYHFSDKEELYSELLSATLQLWLEPLEQIEETGDPVDEICIYIQRKLEMSRDHPRESRLFAGEVLVGIKRADTALFEPLRAVFDSKIALLEDWAAQGRITAQDPHHLLYSIWATTQHYADFEAQIEMLSPQKMAKLFEGAEAHLVPMYRKLLTPT